MSKEIERAQAEAHAKKVAEDKSKLVKEITVRHRETRQFVQKNFGQDAKPMFVDKG